MSVERLNTIKGKDRSAKTPEKGLSIIVWGLPNMHKTSFGKVFTEPMLTLTVGVIPYFQVLGTQKVGMFVL